MNDRRIIAASALIAPLFVVGCEGALVVEHHPVAVTEQGPRGPLVREEGQVELVPEDIEAPRGVDVERTKLSVLPFHVRVNKLTGLVGLPKDHEVFDDLMYYRFELGDHDYARGVRPNLNWDASKIGTWVRAVIPVCESAAFAERYPGFPGDLDAFVLSAYGRRATSDDYAALADGMSGLDEATSRRTACVAMLTAAEFIAP